MSPILIAIPATFGCLAGFAMGLITAAKSKPEFTGDLDLLRGIEYKARMQGDMAALVYGRSDHVRLENETGDTPDPS